MQVTDEDDAHGGGLRRNQLASECALRLYAWSQTRERRRRALGTVVQMAPAAGSHFSSSSLPFVALPAV
jgi:hypothetical protein